MDEARILSRLPLPEEAQVERQLRPQRLDDYVGQREAVESLRLPPLLLEVLRFGGRAGGEGREKVLSLWDEAFRHGGRLEQFESVLQVLPRRPRVAPFEMFGPVVKAALFEQSPGCGNF